MYIWRLLNFREFGPPPSPCQYKIHSTSLPLVRNWLTPSPPVRANVMCTSPPSHSNTSNWSQQKTGNEVTGRSVLNSLIEFISGASNLLKLIISRFPRRWWWRGVCGRLWNGARVAGVHSEPSSVQTNCREMADLGSGLRLSYRSYQETKLSGLRTRMIHS